MLTIIFNISNLNYKHYSKKKGYELIFNFNELFNVTELNLFILEFCLL